MCLPPCAIAWNLGNRLTLDCSEPKLVFGCRIGCVAGDTLGKGFFGVSSDGRGGEGGGLGGGTRERPKHPEAKWGRGEGPEVGG